MFFLYIFSMTLDNGAKKFCSCPICMDILLKDVCVTCCGHTYHNFCLLSCVHSNCEKYAKCPICRVSLIFARSCFQ